MKRETDTPLEGYRVLVLEDEVIIAMLLEDYVAELGGEVVGPVQSASRAMTLIETEDISAATLDVNVAGGNVYDAASALESRSIPFVFVTGYSGLPDCPAAFADTPTLKKPFTLDELADIFEAALEATTRGS